MIKTGKINTLKVLRKVDFGVYLEGEEFDSILLPKRYVPGNCEVDDEIDVFIYFDSDDRIIATTETPYAMVDDIACLKVVAVNSVGAFLDWGLSKDILVPYSEQNKKMREGESYVVKIFFDEQTNRIAASSKLEKFLSDKLPEDYKIGQEVELLICDKSNMGYKAIIDEFWLGILYKNEVYEPLEIGRKTTGYIKKIRDDGKIDLTLYKSGYGRITDLSAKILDELKKNNGFIKVTDKSSPELIHDLFGASKKSYKKAIGALYKKRIIELEKNGVKLSRGRDS
ncbi:MAG: GntR family transcriptional regulator [Chlamydiae bacterium]|nr:MAG: GntR family transcriptional regulator [Chlamydiota bacterium]